MPRHTNACRADIETVRHIVEWKPTFTVKHILTLVVPVSEITHVSKWRRTGATENLDTGKFNGSL